MATRENSKTTGLDSGYFTLLCLRILWVGGIESYASFLYFYHDITIRDIYEVKVYLIRYVIQVHFETSFWVRDVILPSSTSTATSIQVEISINFVLSNPPSTHPPNNQPPTHPTPTRTSSLAPTSITILTLRFDYNFNYNF